MHPSVKASVPVIRRLPKYYRYLRALKDSGVTSISSRELAAQMGTTASQVRQDFNCIGDVNGRQGIGYSVDNLLTILEGLLFGDGQRLSTILIGQSISGIPIRHIDDLESFCAQHNPHVAVLCVPRSGAQQISGRLVELGIKGFWNFSHYDLSVPYPDAVVENVHLGDSLMSLGYRLRHPD